MMALTLVLTGVMLGGCASARKKNDFETENLRTRVAALEMQLQDREDEIARMREALTSRQTGVVDTAAPVQGEKPTTRSIQVALFNAGFNPGEIDGKMGKQTRVAIKEFQKANGLVADGKVGKQTWALLKKYLDAKMK
jgi:peptidoglycan hydrolase-like protein with peptidoglycan-binding domain